ncbi:type II toxin-antitoxin system RelE/ParE family toxin [Congregibacter sp.]|uniref:type II toxin-antitoxin system RelE/ParE family toxin n=1 Tax=Congregibacter sp. TaxID=2744308 RepID=UPI003858C308
MAIKSWKHKGLREFFEKGAKKGIQAKDAKKIELRLDALNSATCPEDMDVLPGWRFHEWHGEGRGTYSVNVSGNWRITFQFEDGDAHVVNYEDPH